MVWGAVLLFSAAPYISDLTDQREVAVDADTIMTMNNFWLVLRRTVHSVCIMYTSISLLKWEI